MALVLLIILTGLFYGTVVGLYSVGWLFAFSIALFIYTLLIGLSKQSALSTMGRIICVISILGIIYCICTLLNINVLKLF